ncbi:MAG: UDP-N-acetylglucosamine 2-epimerase (non-hydrolyzing), partial [Myxococcota bacterium]
MSPHRAMAVIGTRPEVIKLAPVIAELAGRDGFEVRVVATAQHRELLDQALEALHIDVDLDLDLMSANQRLGALTGAVVARMEEVITDEKPDVVLVQGDTTTAFASALAAFYVHVPTAHIEAGLRTGDPACPFPEEINRRLIGGIAALHFAPTERARKSLLAEGISDDRIEVTGNTVIDALLATAKRLDETPALAQQAAAAFPYLRSHARLVLITGHRRENFGAGLVGICDGIAAIAAA